VKPQVVAVSVLSQVKQSGNSATCNSKGCLKEFQQISYKISPLAYNNKTTSHQAGNCLRSNQVNFPTR
jgi:hypothetical protein